MTKQDIDSRIASKQINRRSNGMKYVLVAVVSVLSTLGLLAGGFFLYQILGQKTALVPANNQTNGNNSTSVTSSTSVAPTTLVQPALGNKGQVELTAVRRIPGTTDEVSVEMRINRLADNVGGSDIISVGSTTARNPITSETYQAIDFLRRSSGSASLFGMRRGEPVEAYVVLNVPAGVKAIDIYIDNTQPFKNVAIADANVASGNNNTPIASNNTSPAPSTASSPVPDTPAPSTSVGIQPGQFVQSAVGSKAQVELLSLKRIKDPEAGTRDVVNLQMRIRRLAAEVQPGIDSINVAGTTARNPDTSETYKGVNWNRSSGTVSLYSVRRSASADAYVWLRIPEGVNTIDIFIPDTGAFKNVPIAN